VYWISILPRRVRISPRKLTKFADGLCRMKVLLFTLVRAFEFELAVPVSEIGKKSSVVQRPILINDPKAGSQMPLLLKLYERVD